MCSLFGKTQQYLRDAKEERLVLRVIKISNNVSHLIKVSLEVDRRLRKLYEDNK